MKQEGQIQPMIQDILPKHLKNEYIPKQPTADSLVLGFNDRTVYLKEQDGEITFLTYGEWENYCRKKKGMEEMSFVYLFSIGEKAFFLTDIRPEDENAAEGFRFHRMFATRSMHPKESIFAIATAWHLFVWYRDNQFCGRCATKLVHSEKLRMMQCPCCGNQVFPKIAPAVIVGVTDGDKILMTKYAGREYKRYALIAGFTEIGETAEETVQREVMEEVGLHVENIRYYKSQPWGFDSNLLMGFYCDLSEEGRITLDREELSTAEWVDYHDIPDDPEGLSLTHEMMLYFRDCKMK